jgi:ADP-ribosylglycohydrolase
MATSMAPISIRERYIGLLYASFAADSFALAPHWIYDQAEIAQRFGRVTQLYPPDENEYHQGKALGDQTHYGDQALLLLESLEACGGNFVVEDFARRWRGFWETSSSYRDHATLDTLARLERGHGLTRSGSASTDLGGAARIAPLLVALRGEDPATIVGAVRAQTALTHAAPEVIDAAEFIARMVFLLVKGVTVKSALEMAVALPYRTLQPQFHLQRARQLAALSTTDAIAELGASCPLEKAFPSSIALLLRHSDDFETALTENAHAGGDSAARGMVLGILLGAAHGYHALPARWLAELRSLPVLDRFLLAMGLGEVNRQAV